MTEMDDLISRAEAVKAALELYHTLTDSLDNCEREKNPGGVVMWTAAAEIAKVMVQLLIELPAMNKGAEYNHEDKI